MADLGFWALAAEDPAHVALVTPDCEEVTAGELLASSNQVSHGLRALGLAPGDAVAVLLPNGREYIELYLACLQCGWYLVPINHHLVGPEVEYIVRDSEARVFVADARFADAASSFSFDPERRLSVGGDIEGFRPLSSITSGQPTTLPSDRTTGLVMN